MPRNVGQRGGWFPGRAFYRRSDIRRLDTMVYAVADEMDQRVGELVDNGLVELGILSLHDKAYILAQFIGQVPHQTLKFRKGRADGKHPDTHEDVPEFCAEAFYLFSNAHEFLVTLLCGELGKPCLDRDKLPHHVHQGIELCEGTRMLEVSSADRRFFLRDLICSCSARAELTRISPPSLYQRVFHQCASVP